MKLRWHLVEGALPASQKLRKLTTRITRLGQKRTIHRWQRRACTKVFLSFQFKVSQRERFHSRILFALGSSSENGRRLSLLLPFRSGKAQIWDTIRGRRTDDAIVQWRASKLFVDLPFSGRPDSDAIYTKLLDWTLFFDRSGWSQFTLTGNYFVREAKVPGLLTLL